MLHVLSLHTRLHVTITLVLVALLLWGLLNALRGSFGQGYLAALWVAELLIVAQAVLGVILLINSPQPLRMAMHIVYGLIALMILPGTLSFNRERTTRREALIYALVCFSLVIVVMRSYQTGGGV
ncbi:MAG: hypothetical protein HGA65_05660 [Oscillochloris sp.]|nr:hypothetical protein [Oscillochloris sp.]